jgi:cytochrome-b5 reductase
MVVAGMTIFSIGFGAYLAWPSSSRRALTSSSLPLSPNHFTPVTVESFETNPLDPSTKIITFRIPPALLPENSFLQPIHSIYVKDDDIQVERPYTPLFGIEKNRDAAGRATIWVKRYPQGEVGRWLHSKRVGDVLEIRGPILTWDYAKEMENGKWDEIIMVCGPASHVL